MNVFKLLIPVGIALGIAFLLSEPPVSFDPSKYDLVPAVAPRLAGSALKAAATLLRLPVIGPFLIALLYKENRFFVLRRFVAEYPEIPTYYPIWHPSHEEFQRHVDFAHAEKKNLLASKAAAGFVRATAADYVHAYTTGTITPLQVAQRVLAAISESNSEYSLNAFVHFNHDNFLQQANESTARYHSNTSLGALDGVPIAVKEELAVLGYLTTMGTSFLGVAEPTTDALSIARLRAAGALILGGANMHEMGMGTTGHNIHFGPARNPYDTHRHTGGSSSGSAAAVAAGIVPIAIGADGGGSIRLPSSLCGVYGLKGTFGRVPSMSQFAWSVGHVGPIAASAGDLAAAYLAIAGAHPSDAHSQHQPPPHAHAFASIVDLSDVTIGVYHDWVTDATEDVVAKFNATLAQFVNRGAKVVPISIPFLDVFSKALTLTITSEMAAFLDEYHENNVKKMAADSQIIMLLARSFSAIDFLAAQQVRTRAMSELARVFKDADVLLTPSTPITAPLIALDSLAAGESNVTLTTTLMRYMFLANLAGVPGVSFPVGYDGSGLPISVQAIGAPWHEHLLLRMAHAAESFLEVQQPKVHFDILSSQP